MEYDDSRKATELETLHLEIRKMKHDMTMDAWKVVIAAIGVVAAVGSVAKALGWV